MSAWKEKKRILTLALVLTLLIGCVSPFRVAAVETDSTSLGIAALLILGSAGVVYTPEDDSQIATFGDAMSAYLTQWGADNDKSDAVASWLSSISINLDGCNDLLYIPPDIAPGLAEWIHDLVTGDTDIEVEGETAPDGYAYYNGVLLPELPNCVYDYQYISWYPESGKYFLEDSDTICQVSSGSKYSEYYICAAGSSRTFAYIPGSTDGWVFRYTSHGGCNPHVVYTDGSVFADFIWGNHSVGRFPYSEPSSTCASIAIELSVLLGEVAPGIQEGTHTVDNLVIPSYIDIDSALNYVELSGTAAVQQMLKDTSSGDLTYDRYNELVVSEGSSITGVEISRTPSWCYAGFSIGIAIDITGTGDYDSNCTCIVEGGTSDDTYITLDTAYDTPNLYYLYVGADETSETLTVKVTSVQDDTISATHTVTVEHLSEPTETTPDVTEAPEGEEPLPTEDNPTEPSTDSDSGGSDGSDSTDEKEEAESTGNSSVDDLTEVIPDYSEGFILALQDFAGAMSYTGTDAKLVIPAVVFPQVGELVPSFQLMEETEIDFVVYVSMMPSNLMLLVQSLFTVALIVFCFKEFYATVAYILTLRGGDG